MLSEEEVVRLMAKHPKLAAQSYEDIPALHPSHPAVISRQATINIGTIGHVAHGKSTLVRAISGVNTVRHKNERVRNITIKLGYGNAKIYKCPQCPAPEAYTSFGSEKEDQLPCTRCGAVMELKRHVSFVDCPGHDVLMATMLTGAAVMDAAMLLIAADMPCPQAQTSEHLAAVNIMQLEKIIILQNKIDLARNDLDRLKGNHAEIKRFIKGTRADNAPIVPISAQFRINIDALVQYVAEYIPLPLRDVQSSPKMIVIRSFDVNKPGCEPEELKGGVAGGSIVCGMIKVGDEVEIRPGFVSKDPQTGKMSCQPLLARVTSLFAEQNPLLYAIPGGLIAVGTTLDPTLTKKDDLVGNIIGRPGQLAEVYEVVAIKYELLDWLVGVKAEAEGQTAIGKLQLNETLLINIGSTSSGGIVVSTNTGKSLVKIRLKKPVCTSLREKVVISRKVGKNFRLIGWGHIEGGQTLYS